jgi:hypothetical protein
MASPPEATLLVRRARAEAKVVDDLTGRRLRGDTIDISERICPFDTQSRTVVLHKALIQADPVTSSTLFRRCWERFRRGSFSGLCSSSTGPLLLAPQPIDLGQLKQWRGIRRRY